MTHFTAPVSEVTVSKVAPDSHATPYPDLHATPYPDLHAAQHAIRHLYVHVPFCPSICPYCDFHVLTRRSGMVEAYLAQMDKEARWLAQQYPHAELDTVYLGGGTPSFLRDHELRELVESIQRHLGWGRLENTLEINPGTVSAARAKHWRALGFDRASVGVQSLDDPTLKFLGRQHDAQQARAAVTELLGAGFQVSGDLITAVAGQPLEADIAALSALCVGHVSAYTLTIEAGTPFARQGVQVSEADEERGFGLSAALLSAAGFERYEVSNYARPGQHSRHNLAYWQNHFYLGLGPGAAGHYPPQHAGELAQRRSNPPLHEWLAHDFATAHPASPPESIGPQDSLTDALFMGLRTAQGINLTELLRRTGLETPPEWQTLLERYATQALVSWHGGQLQVTAQGWWHLNKILGELMNALD